MKNYFIKRSLAYLLDCILLYGVVMLVLQGAILNPIRAFFGINSEWLSTNSHMHIYVLLTISLPAWLYFTFLDSRFARGSIGKRIFKLQVTNENMHQKITVGRSFLRTIGKLIPWEISHLGVIYPIPIYYDPNPEFRVLSFIGFGLLIGYVVFLLFSKTHQAPYDHLLNTFVTETKKTVFQRS